jgi:hypothetical protein
MSTLQGDSCTFLWQYFFEVLLEWEMSPGRRVLKTMDEVQLGNQSNNPTVYAILHML